MNVLTAESREPRPRQLEDKNGGPGKTYPAIIQGGMGAGVSNWRLANAVARTGQLGVVSGTALDAILARRLQDGDPGGHMRRALAHFPLPKIVERLIDWYFIPGGKDSDKPYKAVPKYSITPGKRLQELTIAANFVEVWLAKEGHDGPVGVNLLEKIQLPNIFSLYGAMMAGVDYVLMGAGIPREIPGILDKLARHEEARLRINVADVKNGESFYSRLDPRKIIPLDLPPLKRPEFLAIVASVTLAITLIKKAAGKVNGFIIEGPTAGGHNAPPRGQLQLDEEGEPLYGPKDVVDLMKIKELGLPFWVAGSCADPEKLKEIKELGAIGVQAGTLFAYCEESGFTESIKRAICEKAVRGEAQVFTDPVASPTSFPFKVVQLEDTNSDKNIYDERPRKCDLGYLHQTYLREDGKVCYRCPSEPVEDYEKKGGRLENTEGRKCLCNGLFTNIGLPQVRESGYRELALVTSGNDVNKIARFLKEGKTSYTAQEVINYLLNEG
ncbi:MAG: nitronate monooxygenase [Nitrospinaceae bacterium]|jgi:nitronate monooxygenase|nr:nitronate monooxygenase [Nitrospinaceae bacterium]MBT3434322.1 nitronate monooxygenase [Nitrospinaceae bacterium]MBT3820090.1 nitronate monooxygenase [Nitrospinaceae bacterium]MBT4094981.1 nitronate monooxygenase [Nitrospinaceae bacterium]MBT4432252.1 nitronate monooxygenase [Nitrospinaceae bacterium]